jgi:hypothetical protein
LSAAEIVASILRSVSTDTAAGWTAGFDRACTLDGNLGRAATSR